MEYSIAERSAVVWSLSFVFLVAVIVLLFSRAPYSLGLIASENAAVLGGLIIGALVSFIRAFGYLAKAIWLRLWLRGSPTSERSLRLVLAAAVSLVSGLALLIVGSVAVNSGEIAFVFLRGAGSVTVSSSPVAYWVSVGACFFFGSALFVGAVVGYRNFQRQVKTTPNPSINTGAAR
jgi:hypothetical protein